jgi:hypothetical protein
LERPGQAHAALLLLGQAPVDAGDLANEPLAVGVLQVKDLFERPVKVIGDFRDFL